MLSHREEATGAKDKRKIKLRGESWQRDQVPVGSQRWVSGGNDAHGARLAGKENIQDAGEGDHDCLCSTASSL